MFIAHRAVITSDAAKAALNKSKYFHSTEKIIIFLITVYHSIIPFF